MPTNPELRKFIVDHFDDSELTILIADYFEPYQAEERPGLAMVSRAQNLIGYCKRTEQLPNLAAALQEKHPRLYSAEFGVLAVAAVVRQARDPHKCFISYAYEDVGFAEKLAGDLRAAGAQVWIAPHSIQPGEKWMRAIERGLKECGVFLCVLTPNALASEWVRDETDIAIGYAKKGDMRILPLLVQACDPAELSVWLTPLQHIPFERRHESGLMELKSALGLAPPTASQPRAHPILPTSPPLRPPPSQRAGRSNTATEMPASAALTIEDMPMCYVPPGEFIMGGDRYDDEKPEHLQKAERGFWIGKYTVTNAQFKLFVNAGGYRNQAYWTAAIEARRWEPGKFCGWNDEWREGPNQYREPFDRANHPAIGVSWYEALAFTRWLRERLGIDSFGLPSEAQWEYAARGPRHAPSAIAPMVRAANSIRAVSASTLVDFADEIRRRTTPAENRRLYPWGDDADPKKMNFDKTGIGSTSAVGAFPAGISLSGCEDMSGNVWEWTMTKLTADYKDYVNKVDSLSDGSGATRVLRGGSVYGDGNGARCTFRNGDNPINDDYNIGFRVVASPIYL